MAKRIESWECYGNVLYNHFKEIGFCTPEHIKQALKYISEENPGYYLYFGITHNPCGRWTNDYDKALPPGFELNEGIEPPPMMLTETAHSREYEKMYVICHCDDEQEIRDAEEAAIVIGKETYPLRILNKTKGRNGNVPPNAPHYFLYVCVRPTALIHS